ncbi:hypothetical protein HMPREF9148_01599 [Prevotella sp. F0091]|nr:hypothetical protein HMPREF9148_01599 [Prevotella sp. F0091]
MKNHYTTTRESSIKTAQNEHKKQIYNSHNIKWLQASLAEGA